MQESLYFMCNPVQRCSLSLKVTTLMLRFGILLVDPLYEISVNVAVVRLIYCNLVFFSAFYLIFFVLFCYGHLCVFGKNLFMTTLQNKEDFKLFSQQLFSICKRINYQKFFFNCRLLRSPLKFLCKIWRREKNSFMNGLIWWRLYGLSFRIFVLMVSLKFWFSLFAFFQIIITTKDNLLTNNTKSNLVNLVTFNFSKHNKMVFQDFKIFFLFMWFTSIYVRIIKYSIKWNICIWVIISDLDCLEAY